jgi:hypothetical protein
MCDTVLSSELVTSYERETAATESQVQIEPEVTVGVCDSQFSVSVQCKIAAGGRRPECVIWRFYECNSEVSDS